MVLPSAARTAFLDEIYKYGHVYAVGPAFRTRTAFSDGVQSGLRAVTGGKNYDVITVTNLNNAGAGSLRQAIADAKTAGGGWIVFAVSGVVSVTSDLELSDVSNITVDGRGQDITLNLSGGGVEWDDTGSGTGCKNQVWINLRLTRSTSLNSDYFGYWNHQSHDFGPIAFLHIESDNFSNEVADEAWNFNVDCPDDNAVDISALFCSWRVGTNPVNDGNDYIALLMSTASNGTSDHPDKWRLLIGHSYSDANYRLPRMASSYGSPGVQSILDAHTTLVNNFWQWRGVGTNGGGCQLRDGAQLWAENDTWDAVNRAGSDLAIQVQSSSIGVAARLNTVNLRLLNGAAVDANTGSVTDPRTFLDDRFQLCSSGAAHDTDVELKSKKVASAEISGSLAGANDTATSGKTAIIDFPTSVNGVAFSLPTGAAFDAIRSSVLNGLRSYDTTTEQFDGNDLCSAVTTVVRTSTNRITVTANTNLSALTVGGKLFCAVTISGIHFLTWNDLTITATGTAPGEGGSPVATPTEVTSDNDTIDGTSVATASVSLTAGRLYILATGNGEQSTASDQPNTVTWNAGTPESFTLMNAGGTDGVCTFHSGARGNGSVWWLIADATEAATITIAYDDTKASFTWKLWEIASGFDAANPIVQVAVTDDTTAEACSVTLASFADATNNLCGLFVFQWSGPAALAADGSLTEIGADEATTSPIHALAAAYLVGEDTSPSMTEAGALSKGGVAFEIAALPANNINVSGTLAVTVSFNITVETSGGVIDEPEPEPEPVPGNYPQTPNRSFWHHHIHRLAERRGRR